MADLDADADPGTRRELATPDGRARRYLLVLPPRPGGAVARPPGGPRSTGGMPLVVALHGGGDTAGSFATASGLPALAHREGFVAVFPEGVGEGPGGRRRRSWNAGRCCGPARAAGVDDVGFVERLVDAVADDMAGEHPVDRSRLYVLGHSNGGMLAFRLALERPGLFAGIGVQSASIAVDTPGPSVPTDLVAVHGGRDRHHPIDGGRGPDSRVESPYGSVREACARFAAASGRASPVTHHPGPGLAVTDWPGEGPGAVRLVEVAEGTHAWMGPASAAAAARRTGPPAAGGPPHPGFDTSACLWDFLRPK